ncbi:hypothetical protein SBA5_670027 [Candidatus Sulfotelmatomonas gaucii]|uniref:Uncharacterized protein n=1 Tax=Candidatus Sulfuritelmatomonas gaucii TaxID=2043161 RepID=A0A2N9LZE5_9BACT|nr:hypothetical protein SBA5_670027 [Candidatus Sulfotelmatomonas gaucii]
MKHLDFDFLLVRDQTGIFNLFIDPAPPQAYGCNAVADENAMRNYSRLHYREFHERPFSRRIPPQLAV